MHAGLFSVSIIHCTLIWTTEALTCICDLFAYVYTGRGGGGRVVVVGGGEFGL